jgi:hypothetical protein
MTHPVANPMVGSQTEPVDEHVGARVTSATDQVTTAEGGHRWVIK